jgi:hypothetical protein
MSLLSSLLGKDKAIKMVMSLLKQAFGNIGKDALRLVLEAEVKQDWSNKQKFDYVKDSLIAKYKRAAEWKWMLNFLIEWAVGQTKVGKLDDILKVLK